jgi:hypothetical protein
MGGTVNMDFIISAKKLRRSKEDGCVYGFNRKQYTRTHAYPKGTVHVKPLQREKASIIKLSKFGYSINQLSHAIGRSTSYISRVLRTAITRGITHFLDKRKLPSQIRLATSSRRRKMLERYMPLWEAFMLGETDEPP